MFSGTFNMMKIYNSRERKQTVNLSKRTVKYRNALLVRVFDTKPILCRQSSITINIEKVSKI